MAALHRKAALYERLASGAADDEAEQYNVDFLRKGTLDDERPHVAPSAGGGAEAWEAAYNAAGAAGDLSLSIEGLGFCDSEP